MVKQRSCSRELRIKSRVILFSSLTALTSSHFNLISKNAATFVMYFIDVNKTWVFCSLNLNIHIKMPSVLNSISSHAWFLHPWNVPAALEVLKVMKFGELMNLTLFVPLRAVLRLKSRNFGFFPLSTGLPF